MDRNALADELRTARFRTTQFRAGYDEGAVDDFIDELVRRLVSAEADHEIVAAVLASRFPTTKARRGYDMADVDALLGLVTTDLGGPVAADLGGPWPAGTPLPSAVTEASRGFLARLLGH